ncbi:hypothetical protein ACJRO7_016715 [Eucalyptus globulus]|uniref:Uncharacterized protein n=1 Tax=Eucalyptus globulus TaxID=34317 RepID=A0ABD3LDM1_EUCGL
MGTSSSKWWVLRRNLESAVKQIKDMLIRRCRTSPGRRHCIEEAGWKESSSESDGALERAKMVSFHCDDTSHNNPYGCDCKEDDIDGRAENFVANFRRRLQMERQVSLELRYSRRNSFC